MPVYAFLNGTVAACHHQESHANVFVHVNELLKTRDATRDK
jgi:hypothetical protein